MSCAWRLVSRHLSLPSLITKRRRREKTPFTLHPGIHILVGVPPYEFTVTNYNEKSTFQCASMTSPPLYTHAGGYRFRLRVHPPDGLISSSHMSVGLTLDTYRATKLRFPARFTITLQLLNQYKDQDHCKRDIVCKVSKSLISLGVCFFEPKFIPHSDLNWNASKQTEYLKNNCLKFRITKICLLDC